MSNWLAEAHSEWHAVNGARTVCPLDCGVGEHDDYYDDEAPAPLASIRCGNCKATHTSVADVRWCYAHRR